MQDPGGNAPTADIQSQITRAEFQAYLDRNKRVPTKEEGERTQASSQMSEYFAVKDRAGKLG